MGRRLGSGPMYERFAPGAISARLRRPEREIDLRLEHERERIIASTRDSLRLFANAEGLAFYANAPRDPLKSARFAEAIRRVQGGLTIGISPGFWINDWCYDFVDGARVRTITDATIDEISIVGDPAYRASRVYATASVPVHVLRAQLDSLKG